MNERGSSYQDVANRADKVTKRVSKEMAMNKDIVIRRVSKRTVIRRVSKITAFQVVKETVR